MNFLYIALISVALAMDCFAISVCISSLSGAKKFDYIRIPLHFAFFHLGMVFLGYYIGIFFQKIIRGVDHWVAFILLSAIGIKIIADAVQKTNKVKKPATEGRLLLLSLATSVDALVIGITFAFAVIDLHSSSLILAATVAVISFAGLFIGSRLHKLRIRYIGILGGIVLLAIGLKTLLTHIMN